MMRQNADFLERHPLFSSVLLLVAAEVVGHALWLRGVIPDDNRGGQILYGFIPLACVIIAVVLVARRHSK